MARNTAARLIRKVTSALRAGDCDGAKFYFDRIAYGENAVVRAVRESTFKRLNARVKRCNFKRPYL